MIHGRVPDNVNGDNALAVFALAADQRDDVLLVDDGLHLHLVVAGLDDDVVEVRGSDVFAVDGEVEG